jgi:hypothetical protein
MQWGVDHGVRLNKYTHNHLRPHEVILKEHELIVSYNEMLESYVFFSVPNWIIEWPTVEFHVDAIPLAYHLHFVSYDKVSALGKTSSFGDRRRWTPVTISLCFVVFKTTSWETAIQLWGEHKTCGQIC